MKDNIWLDLLNAVRLGEKTPEAALTELRNLPYEDLGFVKIDHHRRLRQGVAEVVYCPGKTDDQIATIFAELAKRGGNILATRAPRSAYEKVKSLVPNSEYNEIAKLIVLWQEEKRSEGIIAVVSAGTADQAVAEEAAITAEVMGNTVERVYDVGVAGIHRLFAHRTMLEKASVIVVVAGMEGALASVVGGLVDKPIVAVPTSVGYGAHMQGIAPLLTMLNSCAAGMAVVNIDNGFGAAVMAHRINRLGEEKRS